MLRDLHRSPAWSPYINIFFLPARLLCWGYLLGGTFMAISGYFGWYTFGFTGTTGSWQWLVTWLVPAFLAFLVLSTPYFWLLPILLGVFGVGQVHPEWFGSIIVGEPITSIWLQWVVFIVSVDLFLLGAYQAFIAIRKRHLTDEEADLERADEAADINYRRAQAQQEQAKRDASFKNWLARKDLEDGKR